MKKRKVWCKGILCLLAAGMVLTGCGKSKEEQAAEYYEEQYGMSEETAEELAGAVWGNEDGENTEENEEAQVKNEFKVYKPLDEMANSKLGDGLVQIHDVLIYENATMTVKEAMDALGKGAEADNYYFSHKRNEAMTDDLVNAQAEGSVALYYGFSGKERDRICTLKYYNPTEDTVNLGDCIIVEVEGKERYQDSETMQCFNVLYAGNLRLTLLQELTEDSEYYEEITSQMVAYDNRDGYLSAQGYGPEKCIMNPNGVEGEVRVISQVMQTGMSGEKEYCYFAYDFKVPGNGRILPVSKRVCYIGADGIVGPLAYSEQVSEEAWDQMLEEVKEEMATINSMDASAYEYLGTILGSVDLFSGGTQTFILFRGSDEKYYLASVPLCVGAQGNLVRNWFVGSEVFDSQEEAIASVINTYEGEIRENPFES